MKWRYVAATATGTSHLKTGRGCDDRAAGSIVEHRTLIAAVADGAGSAQHAARGAELAVVAALESLTRDALHQTADYEHRVGVAATAAREAIFRAADEAGAPAREFACTLLLVALGPDGGAALQIGDGAIIVGDDGADWSWVFWPQHGEYANTTRFVTDDDAPDVWMVGALNASIVDVALFSDGLERLALEHASQSAHAPFFRPLFRALAAVEHETEQLQTALETFLHSPDVTARTDDDTSLVLATLRTGTAVP